MASDNPLILARRKLSASAAVTPRVLASHMIIDQVLSEGLAGKKTPGVRLGTYHAVGVARLEAHLKQGSTLPCLVSPLMNALAVRLHTPKIDAAESALGITRQSAEFALGTLAGAPVMAVRDVAVTNTGHHQQVIDDSSFVIGDEQVTFREKQIVGRESELELRFQRIYRADMVATIEAERARTADMLLKGFQLSRLYAQATDLAGLEETNRFRRHKGLGTFAAFAFPNPGEDFTLYLGNPHVVDLKDGVPEILKTYAGDGEFFLMYFPLKMDAERATGEDDSATILIEFNHGLYHGMTVTETRAQDGDREFTGITAALWRESQDLLRETLLVPVAPPAE